MAKIERVISAVIILALLAAGIWLYHWGIARYNQGYYAGYASCEPEVITETEVEVVTVENEVVIIKEVPVRYYAREFQDFKQLTQFIKNLDIEAVEKPWWDCDDYAYYLWVETISSGFLMSFESEMLDGELHALNSTVIGNTVYFIDLRAGKTWTKGWLD